MTTPNPTAPTGSQAEAWGNLSQFLIDNGGVQVDAQGNVVLGADGKPIQNLVSSLSDAQLQQLAGYLDTLTGLGEDTILAQLKSEKPGTALDATLINTFLDEGHPVITPAGAGTSSVGTPTGNPFFGNPQGLAVFMAMIYLIDSERDLLKASIPMIQNVMKMITDYANNIADDIKDAAKDQRDMMIASACASFVEAGGAIASMSATLSKIKGITNEVAANKNQNLADAQTTLADANKLRAANNLPEISPDDVFTSRTVTNPDGTTTKTYTGFKTPSEVQGKLVDLSDTKNKAGVQEVGADGKPIEGSQLSKKDLAKLQEYQKDLKGARRQDLTLDSEKASRINQEMQFFQAMFTSFTGAAKGIDQITEGELTIQKSIIDADKARLEQFLQGEFKLWDILTGAQSTANQQSGDLAGKLQQWNQAQAQVSMGPAV